MAYDRTKASPSDAAHNAAESLDKIYEAIEDGLSITDVNVIMSVPSLVAYLFEPGISKGEAISRAIQVLSLVERDNSLLSGALGGQPELPL